MAKRKNKSMPEAYTPPMRRQTDEPWHLDKKVPIALIFAILIQTVAAAAYIIRMDGRIETLERQSQVFENWRDGTQGKLDSINVTLGRVDERMQAQQDILREIKETLKKR